MCVGTFWHSRIIGCLHEIPIANYDYPQNFRFPVQHCNKQPMETKITGRGGKVFVYLHLRMCENATGITHRASKLLRHSEPNANLKRHGSF